jgi:hypothetical protein
MAWDNGVSPPGGVSYAAPLMDFSDFGNLANVYRQAGFDQQRKVSNEQQQQLNTQKIAEGQRQQQLAEALQRGGALDANGKFDPTKAMALYARFGDVGALTQMSPMSQQQDAANTPIYPQGGPPQAPQGQPQGTAPASLPARPLPPPAANSPQGDAPGSVISRVTDLMPDSPKIGVVAANVAKLVGADPNGPLTPEQADKADRYLKGYAERNNIPSRAGTMPPSANAGTPAPPAASPQAGPQVAQAGPVGQGAPQAAAMPQQAPPVGPGAPQPPQGGAALTRQVALPEGFTDPGRAIDFLRDRAADLEKRNPKAKPIAERLRAKADEIEKSIAPMQVHQGTNIVDPRNGQPLYQGNQPTLSPDAINAAAERYLETGQLPPNLGRGTQGSATMSAIQNHAAELAQQRGIDMATLPGKWQQFKAQQVGIQRFTSGKQGDTVKSFNVLVDHLDTLTEAASALKNGDMRLFNRFKQNWAANTGNTAPTNFDGVKALVGDEIVKAVVGSAGALADREEVKKDLDRASSPKQLSELVDRYRKLALGQLRGLRKQYEVATGQKNFGDLLLPGTLAALGGNEGKGSAPDAEGWVTLPNGARIQEVK